jgi:hypothetical protein
MVMGKSEWFRVLQSESEKPLTLRRSCIHFLTIVTAGDGNRFPLPKVVIRRTSGIALWMLRARMWSQLGGAKGRAFCLNRATLCLHRDNRFPSSVFPSGKGPLTSLFGIRSGRPTP